MQVLTATALKEWLAEPADGARAQPVLLDVREPQEYDLGHLANSVHIPMRDIPQRMQELEDTAQIVCICHHGARSMQVALFLERHGFEHVYNLTGGVDAWARQIDPGFPIY